MRLEIYNPEKVVEVNEPTRLALLYDKDGVALTAVDKAGKRLPCGDLLYIKPNGTFVSASCVNVDLGFQLTDGDKIQLVEEE